MLRRAMWPRLLLSWGVHLFTASGAVVGAVALLAIGAGDARLAALLMLTALVIDSVDGALARVVGVGSALPGVDGRRLDDIVDYLNYVIVPVVFLVALGILSSWWWAAAPIVASAYGFSQTDAKTEDNFFLGFPSYWNVVAIYLWLFEIPPVASAALVSGLSILVFVPIKYVHLSRLRVLGRISLAAAAVWIAVVTAAVLSPAWNARLPLAEASLAFPAYYVVLSLRLGGLRREGAGAASHGHANSRTE